MAYSPATAVTNNNLPTTVAKFYDTVAFEALTADLAFKYLTTERTIPMKSGKSIQIYSYDLSPFTAGVSAGSTPSAGTEGTVGTGLTPTQTSVSATLGQYFDYIAVSDMALQVGIDDTLEHLSKMLGYRAGLLYDTLILNEFDALITADSTSLVQIADGSYLTANVVRAQVQSLHNRNARTFEDGTYHAVIHPLVFGDMINDNSTNGFIDIAKRNAAWQAAINKGFQGGTSAQGIEWAGVKFMTSTNVSSFANTPSAGKTSWGTYIAGKDAAVSIGLGNTGKAGERNFEVKVLSLAPSAADMAGVIGGGVSYNYKTVICAPPRSVNTFKRINSETALT